MSFSNNVVARMNKVYGWLSLCALAFGGIVMLADQGNATAGYTPVISSGDGDVVPVEDSMHEFMEYVFQPTYLRLKQSMAAAPSDNKGWKAIKSDSLILAESCNLLFGRKPAEHGEDWVKHATASKEFGAKLYIAAKARNFDDASTAYKTMLDSCNACHKQFENGKHILQP
jgi:prephenate dehydratase